MELPQHLKAQKKAAAIATFFGESQENSGGPLMLTPVPRRFAGWAAPLSAVSATVHGAGFMLDRRSFTPRVVPYRVVRKSSILAGELGLAGRMDVAKLPAAFVVVGRFSRTFVVFSHSGTPSCLLLIGMGRLIDRVAARATECDQDAVPSGTVATMGHRLQVLAFGPANR